MPRTTFSLEHIAKPNVHNDYLVLNRLPHQKSQMRSVVLNNLPNHKSNIEHAVLNRLPNMLPNQKSNVKM